GVALFAWAHAVGVLSRTWRDAWIASVNLPLPFTSVRSLRLAPRPGTRDVHLAALQADRHLELATWSSALWNPVSFKEITPNAASGSWRCFDLAFTVEGSALLV